MLPFLVQANRDIISNEMQKMRQQLEYLQAELFSRGGATSEEVQVLPSAVFPSQQLFHYHFL